MSAESRAQRADVKVQLKAVRVLADMLSRDLPPANWTVYPLKPPHLYGQVVHSGAETPNGISAAHDEIEQWARFLGVDVVAQPHTPYETIHLMAEGVYEGVEVDVAAIIPDDGGAWRERLGR
ncbi:hypothetical protein GCM10010191_28710 [Actinomadura vinacea]|uniref:Uncharacterized protein n=1 Tax=Actinomadura vinacea TaxID=115336 RepID=A0ABN3IXZ6_9ACTN